MTAESTTTPTCPIPLPPGPEGLSIDLNCPQCEYNWRGLTVPRCPECGHAFAWRDVPRLLEQARARSTPGEIALKIVLGLILFIAFLPALLTHPLAALALAAGLIFLAACTALYAFVELAIAMIAMWSFDATHYFRRWWEGVMISTSVASCTMALLGINIERMIRRGWKAVSWEHAMWLTAIFGCAVVIQYAVIKVREKRWGYPVPGPRLGIGMVVSKLIMLIVLGGLVSIRSGS